MQVAPQISLKGIRMTSNLDDLMSKGIARMERACDYIISASIALEQDQGSHQVGNAYRMRIEVTIPDRPTIVVKRFSKGLKKVPNGQADLQIEGALETQPRENIRMPAPSPDRRRGVREEPLAALIRRAFDSAERELEKTKDRQRGAVKTPAQQENAAVVEQLFRNKGYGFLRTVDGQQVYFHKNSVLRNQWDELRAGTGVRYVGEMGEKGLQASSVQLVEKRGAAEAHDRLHELPDVSPKPAIRRKVRSAS